MQRSEFDAVLNDVFSEYQVKDYAPNGLQVQGTDTITRVVTGVTACQALLDAAVAKKADAILVHHGYFWKNEPQALVGMKYQRIKTLMEHNINLYGYHLPLDIHPELGNNAQLARVLDLTITQRVDAFGTDGLLFLGELKKPCSPEAFSAHIAHKLGRTPLFSGTNAHTPKTIQRVAWCTGGAQDGIDVAADYGVDAYLSGEVSERTIHSARERGLYFYSCGHHATERYGIQALGQWLKEHHGLDVSFVDIDNPA